jgi:NAD(P)H-flavin reductase
MLDQLSVSNAEVHIGLGVRRRNEALFAEEFRSFAEAEGWHFHLCVSRERPKAPDERSGYVTQLISALDVQPERDLVFLCGNPNMVDDGVDALKERKFSPRKIRREKYI